MGHMTKQKYFDLSPAIVKNIWLPVYNRNVNKIIEINATEMTFLIECRTLTTC